MSTQNAIDARAADIEASRAALTERGATAGDLARGEAAGPEHGQIDIEFLANLAHQLRSPLSSLRVWVDLLSDPGALASPEGTKRLVEGIDRATARLERQISDVLEVGYLQAGTLTVETIAVDAIEQLVTAVAGAEHAARSRRIKIDLRFGKQPAMVTASPERLRQAIACLLSNAIRFSPVDGTITVTTGTRPHIAVDPSATSILKPQFDGSAYYICVSDNGPGIAPSAHREVFKPFHRASRKDAHGGGGSGLGLTIAAGLLELQSAGLWLRSDISRGAEFEIALPLSKQQAPAVKLN